MMNWCEQLIMIFFSEKTCSCCCVSTMCFFFRHLSANVRFWGGRERGGRKGVIRVSIGTAVLQEK